MGGSGGDCCKPGGGANLSAGYAPAGGGQQNAMIVGAPSNRCVDVAGANTGNGTDAIIGDCHGGANQPWNVNANGAGTANGTRIHLWIRNGGGNQQWSLRT